MAVITRSRRLRTPEWSARLDLSHRMLDSIAFAALASSGPVDLVTGVGGTQLGVGHFALPDARGAKFAGTADQGYTFNLRPLSSGNLWTILAYCNPVSSGGPHVIFSQRNANSPFEQVALAVNSTASLTGSAGSLAFFARTTAPVAVNGSETASAVTGQPAWYGVTVRADDTVGGQRYFRDGALLAAVKCSSGTLVTANETLRIGNLAGFASTGFGANFSIGAVFAWNRILSDAEVAEFCADPWVVLAQSRRIYVGVVAAAGATIAVPAASLTLAAQAPTATATANQRVAVPSASLSLAANAPTVAVSDHQSVAVPAAALSLSALTPSVSVSDHQAVAVPAASLSLAANAPTVAVSSTQAVAVPAAALTLSAQTPTVAVTDHQLVAVPAASLSLTAQTPVVSLSGNQAVQVPAAALALNAQAPSVQATGNQAVNVPAAALTLAANAPAVVASDRKDVAVPAASLSLTAVAPVVTTTANQTIQVPLASLTLAGLAPAIVTTEDRLIVVPAAALTLTGYAPNVSDGSVARIATVRSQIDPLTMVRVLGVEAVSKITTSIEIAN